VKRAFVSQFLLGLSHSGCTNPAFISKFLLQNDKEYPVESFIYDPPYHFSQIIVVGLGGTGSQLARCLARLLYHRQQQRQHIPEVLFVDPDVIELHNVGRQMFTPAEVGQPKAAVLARRFNLALGLQIAACCEPVDSQKHLPRGSLVCGCVDNHRARAELARGSGFVWLDTGNGYDFGQVVVGNCGDAEQVRRGLKQAQNGRCAYLPHAGLVFPALLQPEPEVPTAPPLSCAELVIRDEQQMFVNDFVATTAAQYLYCLLNREPLTTFATFLNLTPAPSVKSLRITLAELEAYLN
jgi:PRTRC genetic system ThiF family protein